MTEENLKLFENILSKEDEIISAISKKQKDLRDTVQKKNWEDLVFITNQINDSSNDFLKIDAERDRLQKMMTGEELQPYARKIMILRSKLSSSKIENQVLNDYIKITRGFIGGVLEQASPKTYSNNGNIVQKQPVSVVLDINF
ncbi:MAG: hypothetical protein HUK25_03590 [Treponema sp.]|nr:hypothetical protein [Treponema sp.]